MFVAWVRSRAVYHLLSRERRERRESVATVPHVENGESDAGEQDWSPEGVAKTSTAVRVSYMPCVCSKLGEVVAQGTIGLGVPVVHQHGSG